jgi:hypothetical protein
MLRRYLSLGSIAIGLLVLLAALNSVCAENIGKDGDSNAVHSYILNSEDIAKNLGSNANDNPKYELSLVFKSDKGNFKYCEKNITKLNATINVTSEDAPTLSPPIISKGQVYCERLYFKSGDLSTSDLNLTLDIDNGMPSASRMGFSKTNLTWGCLFIKVREYFGGFCPRENRERNPPDDEELAYIAG